MRVGGVWDVVDLGTTFREERNGIWWVSNFSEDGVMDLVSIKMRNTRTGMVEVHVASGKGGN